MLHRWALHPVIHPPTHLGAAHTAGEPLCILSVLCRPRPAQPRLNHIQTARPVCVTRVRFLDQRPPAIYGFRLQRSSPFGLRGRAQPGRTQAAHTAFHSVQSPCAAHPGNMPHRHADGGTARMPRWVPLQYAPPTVQRLLRTTDWPAPAPSHTHHTHRHPTPLQVNTPHGPPPRLFPPTPARLTARSGSSARWARCGPGAQPAGTPRSARPARTGPRTWPSGGRPARPATPCGPRRRR